MDEPLRLVIKNSFEEIARASETVTEWLEARKVAPAASYLANLAIEELITNCIKYGYEDQREHDIEIYLSVADAQMALIVSDDGHAFNPLEAPEPDINLPIEDRPVGGLGLHLLRKLADHIKYERNEGQNRVTILKRLV
jgi:anti-sigma regulatory factor (Ser/Thr protein kinase)